jgi:putative ATPase
MGRALQDSERGLGGILQLDQASLEFIARGSEGDARRALTTLESLALMGGGRSLTLIEVSQFLSGVHGLGRQPLPYDKAGEEHYNVVSAFIKSMRQGDPQAGLYYLARMIEGGEDPLFIARRLVVFASEDIGNADPRALQIAVAAKESVEFIGMPEGRIALSQATTYFALAPKSRAVYDGMNLALEEVQKTGAVPVPLHLRNAVTPLMRSEGYGRSDDRVISSLPPELQDRVFYRPTESGFEKQLKEKLHLRSRL